MPKWNAAAAPWPCASAHMRSCCSHTFHQCCTIRLMQFGSCSCYLLPCTFLHCTKSASVSQTASVPRLSSEEPIVPGRTCRSDAFPPPCTAPFSTGQSAHVSTQRSQQTRPSCCCCHSFASQDSEERG